MPLYVRVERHFSRRGSVMRKISLWTIVLAVLASSPVVTIPVKSQAPAAKARSITSYDVENYVIQPGDQSFVDISRKIYGTEQASRALLLFNRDHPLAADAMKQGPPQVRPGMRVYFPPLDVLKTKYPEAWGTFIALSSPQKTSKKDFSPDPACLPVVQHVNKRDLAIEYEISRVGKSGVGSVDLWWTQDDGRTWTTAPTPEKLDPVQKGRYQRSVALMEGDGVYGFTIVVRSRAGLGKRAPRPGDAPALRIELDTVPPSVSLLKPKLGSRGAHDALILMWKAEDKNLAPQPITLEWSEKATGPWRTIAADLANTGRYVWTVAPEVPLQVHVRIRARDLAGNEGVAVTPEPMLLDTIEPEARIVGIVP
jgi:hypothetical protein